MRIAKSLMEAKRRPAGPALAQLSHMHALIREGRTEEALRYGVAALQDADGGPLVELARHVAQHGSARLALDLVAFVGQVRPDLVAPLAKERAFRALLDDPRFLQMAGQL